MIFKMISIFMAMIFLSSCTSNATNLMDYIAVSETQKAGPENKKVGYLNSKAPMIKEEVKETPKQKMVKNQTSQYKSDIEMVGYIVSVDKDADVDLYVYTFTDALKTRTIQFFYTKKLSYSTSELLRINVKDNFLKIVKPYSTNKPIKKKVNSYIQSAKEYFIKTR